MKIIRYNYPIRTGWMTWSGWAFISGLLLPLGFNTRLLSISPLCVLITAVGAIMFIVFYINKYWVITK